LGEPKGVIWVGYLSVSYQRELTPEKLTGP
jgi:hypothetical protein